MENHKRLTTYIDGEARVLGIGHKPAFMKLAQYEDTGLTPEEVNKLRGGKIMEVVALNDLLMDELKQEKKRVEQLRSGLEWIQDMHCRIRI